MERHEIRATQLGFRRTATSRLKGGTAAENARMVEAILGGEPGARRDVVLLNAGAALLVAGAVEQLEEGIDKAALTIDAGLGDGAARGAARRPASRRGRGRRAGRAGGRRHAAAEGSPA